RFLKPSDDARRIMQIEQNGADAVFPHRANAMRDDQPASLGLKRRAAVSNLCKLPCSARPQQRLVFMPVVRIVGEHNEEVFIILSGKHRIASIYLSREQSHAFISHSLTI